MCDVKALQLMALGSYLLNPLVDHVEKQSGAARSLITIFIYGGIKLGLDFLCCTIHRFFGALITDGNPKRR